MAMRIKSNRRVISVVEHRFTKGDIVCAELALMLAAMPDARYIEIAVVEHYDDGEPE